MRFIKNKDALKICGVVRQFNLFLVLSETLYVDNSYLLLAGGSLLGLIIAELFHQFLAGIGCSHDKSTGFKLLCGLFEKVKTVNYKIELGDFILSGKIIIEDI